MKKIIIAAVILIIITAAVIAVSSTGQSVSQSNTVSFSTVQSNVNSGAKLYDVRTSQEHIAGHFENAENWSLQEMQAGKFPDIDKNTKLYVYCQSGNRSSQAAKLLKAAGFIDVIDMGGLQDVQKSGGKLQ